MVRIRSISGFMLSNVILEPLRLRANAEVRHSAEPQTRHRTLFKPSRSENRYSLLLCTMRLPIYTRCAMSLMTSLRRRLKFKFKGNRLSKDWQWPSQCTPFQKIIRYMAFQDYICHIPAPSPITRKHASY